MSYLSIKNINPDYINYNETTEILTYNDPRCNLNSMMIHLHDIRVNHIENMYHIHILDTNDINTLQIIQEHLRKTYQNTKYFLQGNILCIPFNAITYSYFKNNKDSADIILKYLKFHESGNRIIIHVNII